jgi:hypothetical protein
MLKAPSRVYEIITTSAEKEWADWELNLGLLGIAPSVISTRPSAL